MRTLDAHFTLNKITSHEVVPYYQHLEDIKNSQAFIQVFKKRRRAVEQLPVEEIASILHSQYKEGTFTTRKKEFLEEVAPKAIILEDLALYRDEKLHFINNSMDIIVRAIQGHAQAGHGAFHFFHKTENPYLASLQKPYPNTSTNDVLKAVGTKLTKKERLLYKITNHRLKEDFQLSPTRLARRTQQHIDELVSVIDDFFLHPQEYTKETHLCYNDKPLFGIELLKDQPINFVEFLRGLYFGLHMDGEKRKIATSQFGVELGGGSYHIVDMDAFAKYGLDLGGVAENKYFNELKLLEKLSHDKRMGVLSMLGVTHDTPIDLSKIASSPNFSWDLIKEYFGINTEAPPKHLIGKNIQNIYFRERKGVQAKGISDDLAIYLAGLIPNTFRDRSYRPSDVDHISRIIGAFVADHIDTIQSDSQYIFTGGQDEALVAYLEYKWKEATNQYDFRKMHAINTRLKDVELIPDSIVAQHIAMGANYKRRGSSRSDTGKYQIIHSSQRWFFKELLHTCAHSEYMKMNRDMLQKLGISDQKPFATTPNEKVSTNVNLTFEQVPIGEIEKEYHERAQILANPMEKRKKTIEMYVQKRAA